jgi:hypothetical protein
LLRRVYSACGGDDQLNRVTDRADLIGVIVRDFDVEVVLDLEYDIDKAGRINLQVLLQRRLMRNAAERLFILGEGLKNLDNLVEDFLIFHGDCP